jgi:hypothetical protein
MFKEKKKRKKKLSLLGLEPAPLSYNAVDSVVLAYWSTLQSGGNALGGSYLKCDICSKAFCSENTLQFTPMTKIKI